MESSGLDKRATIDKLMDLSYMMPDGETKVALLEQAVQLADELGDVPLAYDVRMYLIDSAVLAGKPELMVVHFPWCLATYDADPESYNYYSLLWKYKWVVTDICDFPTISAEKILELLADMKTRYESYGAGMHGYWSSYASVMRSLDRTKEADTASKKMAELPRDILSNCNACEINSVGATLYNKSKYDSALEQVKPILEDHMSCSTVPHTTLGWAMMSHFQLGNIEEAIICHRRGYPLVRGRGNLLVTLGHHIRFLALTNNLVAATRIIEKHLPTAMDAFALESRFYFLCGVHVYLLVQTQENHQQLSIRLPDSLPVPSVKGKVSTKELTDWCISQLQEIAAQFDQRNGTKKYQKTIKENSKKLTLFENHPFVSPAGGPRKMKES
ncbi:MAG: hypothetical protein R3B84_12925 [Zavarzinella sp.]